MKVLLLLLCLFAASSGVAGTYRWVDENGQAHFGDRPPAGAVSDEISMARPAVDVDTVARERKQRMNEFLEQSDKERAERNKLKAREEARATAQEARCQQLRGRLKHLQRVSRIYRINNDGERVYVDDEENERLRREFSVRVHKECGT